MLLLLLAGPAWSLEVGEASVSVTDDFKLRYYRNPTTLPDFPDNDHLFDYVEQVNRLNLQASYEGTEVGVSVDEVALFAATYYLDDELQYEHYLVGDGLSSFSPTAYVNLEKIWLTQRVNDAIDVQVGDGYLAFGRGLAVNLVKNTDIDVDTSVQGAQARLSSGDWDATLATGLTNQQQVQQDNPNVALRPNAYNMVTGAGVQRYGLGPSNVGVHGVAYSFSRETAGLAESVGPRYSGLDAVVGGATLEAFGVLGLDLYGEVDIYRYMAPELLTDLEDPDGTETGRAFYGSVAAYPGKVTLLLEVKDYLNIERLNIFSIQEGYEVSVGPNLEYERVITEDSSSAVNSNNIRGARLRADIAARPGVWTPYISMAGFRDYDLGSGHFNQTVETILHPVAGMDLFGDHVQSLINFGYRADLRDDVNPESGEADPDFDFGADRLAHADIDFRFPVGRLHAEAILDFQKFWWGENVIQQHDFTQASLTLAVGGEGPFSLSLFGDYSDNPLISTDGNLSFITLTTTDDEGEETEENPYGALEVQYKPTGSTTLRLFYGAYRAGIRCSGGQCRNLPGFDGARLSFSTAF